MRFVRLFSNTFLGLYYAQSLIAFLSCQGAKKVSFTASHSETCSYHYTSRKVIPTSPQKDFGKQFFCNLNSSNNFTCPSGKLGTEFDSPIAKSTTLEYQTLVSLHTVTLILLTNKNVTVMNKKKGLSLSGSFQDNPQHRYFDLCFHNQSPLLTKFK